MLAPAHSTLHLLVPPSFGCPSLILMMTTPCLGQRDEGALSVPPPSHVDVQVGPAKATVVIPCLHLEELDGYLG